MSKDIYERLNSIDTKLKSIIDMLESIDRVKDSIKVKRMEEFASIVKETKKKHLPCEIVLSGPMEFADILAVRSLYKICKDTPELLEGSPDSIKCDQGTFQFLYNLDKVGDVYLKLE